MDDLHSKIDPSIPTVIAGDFNTAFDRSIDRFGSDAADSSGKSSSSLWDLFNACCVVNIWRYLHPFSSSFMWTRWNGSLASRIDLFGVHMFGCLLCRLVIFSRVLFLIIVLFPCLSLSLMLFPLVLACGSSIFQFWMRRNMLRSFLTFGRHGVLPSSSFPPLPSGGRWVRAISRAFPFVPVV